jgi:hypothetical protein
VARFTLAKLMLLLTIFCAAGAALSYLGQGLRSPQNTNMRFVLFSLIAPSVLLLVASVLVRLLAEWKRRRSAPHGQAEDTAPNMAERLPANRATGRFGVARRSAPGANDKSK